MLRVSAMDRVLLEVQQPESGLWAIILAIQAGCTMVIGSVGSVDATVAMIEASCLPHTLGCIGAADTQQPDHSEWMAEIDDNLDKIPALTRWPSLRLCV